MSMACHICCSETLCGQVFAARVVLTRVRPKLEPTRSRRATISCTEPHCGMRARIITGLLLDSPVLAAAPLSIGRGSVQPESTTCTNCATSVARYPTAPAAYQGTLLGREKSIYKRPRQGSQHVFPGSCQSTLGMRTDGSAHLEPQAVVLPVPVPECLQLGLGEGKHGHAACHDVP